MSFEKGENITVDELNGIISVFKQYHMDKEYITSPNDLNDLTDCTFQFINHFYTNEELIFENEIRCKIIPKDELDLGRHYLIKCQYYAYGIDDDPSSLPALNTGIFDLVEDSNNENHYTCTLEDDVIYMKLENIILVTKYDKKIIQTVD